MSLEQETEELAAEQLAAQELAKNQQPQTSQPAQDDSRRQLLVKGGKIAVGALPVLAALNSRTVLARGIQAWSQSAAASANGSVQLAVACTALGRNALSFYRQQINLNTWPLSVEHGFVASDWKDELGTFSPWLNFVHQMKNSLIPDTRLLRRGATLMKELTLAGQTPCNNANNAFRDFPVLQVLWGQAASAFQQRRLAHAAIAGVFNAHWQANQPNNIVPASYPLNPALMASLIRDMYDGRRPSDPSLWLGATTVVEFLEQTCDSDGCVDIRTGSSDGQWM